MALARAHPEAPEGDVVHLRRQHFRGIGRAAAGGAQTTSNRRAWMIDGEEC